MAKVYTTKEALEIVMESDCEDGSSSSDSETDTEEASDVEPEQLESSSSSADSSEGEQEPEVEAEGWAPKNGKIVWSATNNQTLRYIPAARGPVLGHVRYAAARIWDLMTSFSLLLTDEIIQHILAVTNLHGRREITGWQDLDMEELQAYMGLIILAGVYRLKPRIHSQPVEREERAGHFQSHNVSQTGPAGVARMRKCRRLCDFCRKRKVGSTCCKCGRFSCKDHSLIICSLCSTYWHLKG